MDDPLIGQHLGNYRIDSVVGRGGMAIVYRAFDESLHRPVAVKVIDARYRDNPVYAQRFLQEARAVATWRHEHILQVFYAGQQDDWYYFAMEYVDGPDLSKVMKQYADAGELMPHDDVLKIGRAVASALDYAHGQGIIHRDVKPSNVMVARDGRIALADFGLALDARQGSFGGTFGTPHYIAPEQARNSATAVPQSDLYALGIILYEMLTGAVPFDDPSPTSLAVQHLTQPPPPPRQLNPNLNVATETALLKALQKQPADRYQSGAALMAALTTALQEPLVAAEPDALPMLPGGVAVPAVSQMSVAERVSLYLPPPPPAAQTGGTPPLRPSTRPPLTPNPPVEPPPSTRWSPIPFKWLVIGGVIMALLLVARGFVLRGVDTAVTPDPSPIVATQPTDVAALPADTVATDTATSTALSAGVPPTAATSADTTAPSEPFPTTAAVDTAVPAGDTPMPTAVPPTETPVPAATEAPTTAPATAPTATPSGPRLMMFYDGTSFYLYNPNANGVRVSPLVFESLDENGNLSGYWFEGRSWAQFYSFVEPFGCARLEMTKVAGWLRPSQCREYNSTVTPEQDGDVVFWTARPGVAAFRVVWQGQEVGRCSVNGSADANQCEVYLP
ncbi:MAG: protein kinase [Anaerolineae bacterium]|nr:protein kinase [Anaerolineae bacterium]